MLGKLTLGMRTNNVNGAGGRNKRIEETSTTTTQDIVTLLQNYLDDNKNSGSIKQKEQFAKENRKDVDSGNLEISGAKNQFAKKDFGYSADRNNEQKKQFVPKNNKNGSIRKNSESELYKYLKVLHTLVDREIKRIDKRRDMESQRNESMNLLDYLNSI